MIDESLETSSTNLDSPYPPDVKAGFDELCPVCGDKVSGYHYGLLTCESCKGFFKRTVQNKKVYSCVDSRQCPIDKSQRKRCPYCRFQKCLNVGMKLEAVRQDRMRGGRNKFGPMYKRDRAMKQQQFRSQQRLNPGAAGECGEAAGGLQQPGSPPDIKPDPALLQASLGLGYGSPTAMANHVDISSMAAAMAAAVVGGTDGMRGGDGRDGLATSPTSGNSYVNLSHPANPAPARNLPGGGGGGGSPPIHIDDGSSRALNLHTSQHQQQQHQQQQQHNGLQHHSPHSGRNNNNNSSNSTQHHPHPHPHHLPQSHSHAHPTTPNVPQPHTSHTHPPPTPVMDNNHPYLLHNANNNPPATHHHHGYPVSNANTNTSTANPKENGMSPSSSITGGGGGGSSNGSSMSMDNLRGFGAPPPSLPGLLREIKANLLEEGEMKQKMLSFLTDTLRQMDGGLSHADHLLPIVCRMVDQLLFLMVEWARSSPFFKEIRVEDQMKLLQHSWSEILILDFVYRQVHEYWGTELVLPNGPRLSFETLDKLGLSDVRVHLFELIKKSRELKLDYNEYMCLKFLILLNPDVSSLENRQYVEQSQEKVNAALREYCLAFYPNLKDKFGQILLRLPEIRIISIQLEEFLYYKHLNNLVPDQTLLTEMLQSRRK